MTLSSYSTRLGYLSQEQFQKALERFGLGDFIKAERIPFGLFGQNVFLTSSKGEFVFRGVPHRTSQFPTECFFTNLLHWHTNTPVPYPYLIETNSEVFGWPYAIMPRLPGITLQDPAVKLQLSIEDRKQIARAVAEMLVEIQSLTWDSCGSFQVDTGFVKPFKMNYHERVVQNIHEKIEASSRYNENTTPKDKQYVDAILSKTKSVVHLPFQPTVVLGDYGEHNLVVEKSEDRWRVSGVFDLMTAHFGDGAVDLSGPVMGYLKEERIFADTFLQEYQSHKPAQEGFVEIQQLYMLDLALSIWHYFQKYEGGLPDDDTKKGSFEQWAKPFIEYWSK